MDWQNILNISLNILKQNRDDLTQFETLKSNTERIRFLLERKLIYLSELEPIFSKYICNKSVKSLNLSEENRKRGNIFYSQKLNKKAFASFNNALMLAPDYKSSILAYSNRSAVFFDEMLNENCLIDIETALNKYRLYLKSDQYNDDLIDLLFKLLNRKKACHFNLNQLEQLKQMKIDTYNPNISIKEPKLENLKQEIDVLLNKTTNSIQETNIPSMNTSVRIASINDCVDIKYDDLRGRHCIANRDIKCGEYLFLEKAYCAILLPEFSDSYCQNCFKTILIRDTNNIYYDYLNIEFCSNCNDVVYCSEQCKQSDLHHKFECGILSDLLHNLGIAHLAYRIVASTSHDMFTNLIENQKDIMEIDYKNERNLQIIEYEQVFRLLTHENETHVYDLFKYALTSILLGSFYLKFNNQTDLLTVSSLLLRHLLQTICNAHAITQMKDDLLFNQTCNREQIRYATAIFPKVSLLNHSCDPNVFHSFKENSSVIEVKASRNIPKDSEIFNCYGPHYLKMSLYERKQALLEQYRFNCLCIPCSPQIKTNKSNLKCFKCKSSITETKNQTDIQCLKCSSVTPIQQYIEQFEIANFRLNKLGPEDYNKSVQLVNNYKILLFINDLNEIDFKSLDSLEDNFKIFYLDFSKLLDFLSRILCELFKFKEAANLCDKSIKILEYIYGSNNVEVAHELFKLSEIQCNCQDFKSALINLNKAITIAEKLYSKDSKVLNEFNQLKNNILSIKSS